MIPASDFVVTSFCIVGPVSEYGITFQTHIVDKFGVSFGREGETMSLGCTVIIYPALHRYQPEVEWYRDGRKTYCDTEQCP